MLSPTRESSPIDNATAELARVLPCLALLSPYCASHSRIPFDLRGLNNCLFAICIANRLVVLLLAWAADDCFLCWLGSSRLPLDCASRCDSLMRLSQANLMLASCLWLRRHYCRRAVFAVGAVCRADHSNSDPSLCLNLAYCQGTAA